MVRQQTQLPSEATSWTDDERERASQLLDGHATVVNVRKQGPHRHLVPWLQRQGLLTYVGHSGPRHSWAASEFASPFVREAKADREAMVRHYEQWLDQQPDLVRRLREGELSGRALGCWCAPEICHADVLAHRAD
ncbi:DUF4326 domain-containing protein [Saccharopolyspora sp. NFXS83]|uniref:DUF4326 domain-containing protein n=1 Tax=Saccharopolyspora sp. NFXS83 TaxID=2993560 RepID=UPI00224B5C17|nr:DUF4326 domain-containing protein [Saccharopolyspora sp. NFXS83]MCX2731839.1 DUF4326 domain-containing protein [Saccharopolyspora sp. NFXS83]